MRASLFTAALLTAGLGSLAHAAPPGRPGSVGPGGTPATGATAASPAHQLAAASQPSLATLQARFGPQSRHGLDAEGRVHALRRLAALLPEGPRAAAVARVFMENRALFGLAPNAPVVPALREELALPAAAGHVLTFDLTVDGVPLDGGSLAARLRPDGRLAELRMDPLPARLVGLASAPRLSPEAARAAAVALGTDPRLVGAAALVYFAAAPSEGRLAWRVPVAARPLADHGYVWLDATDGTLLARRAATLH
jgi:hypothetical protein